MFVQALIIILYLLEWTVILAKLIIQAFSKGCQLNAKWLSYERLIFTKLLFTKPLLSDDHIIFSCSTY